MRTPVHIISRPQDVKEIQWRRADRNMQARLKRYIALRLLPRFIVISIAVFAVGGFSSLFFLMGLKNNTIGEKFIVLLFLFALGGVIMGGVLSMAGTDKKMSGLSVAFLFSNRYEITTGGCTASYVKEMGYGKAKEAAWFADFQVGTYKITRGFAKEVPIGTKHVFVKPLKPGAEILFFPLEKIGIQDIQLDGMLQDDYAQKMIKSKYFSGTEEDFHNILWQTANSTETRCLRRLIKLNMHPNLLSVVFPFSILLYVPCVFLFYMGYTFLLDISLIIAIGSFLVTAYMLVFVTKGMFLPILWHVRNVRAALRMDEILTAKGKCAVFMRQNVSEPTKPSYRYYAEFEIDKVYVRVRLKQEDYSKLTTDTVYMFVKPECPKGMWIGYPEVDISTFKEKASRTV